MDAAPGSWGDQHTLTRMDWKARDGSKATCCRNSGEQIGGSHGLVVGGGMVLRKVVGSIGDAGLPEDVELALVGPVAEPIESHVDRFGASLFYSVIGNAAGSVVVSLDRRGWLGMAQFVQGNANGADVLSI